MKWQVNSRLPAQLYKSSKKKITIFFSYLAKVVRARPLTSFLLALILLLALIVLGKKLQSANVGQTKAAPVVKNVDVYTIGKVPTVKVQAQIQNDGLITIVAQNAGIVQKVAVREGDSVIRGTNLVSLSTNYQGGNTLSLSRQLAAAQLQNVNDTFDKQNNTLSKQRDLANKTADNTEQLRQISVQSLNDTNSLLNTNQDIVNTLDNNLQNLQNNNTNGQNDQLILNTKEQIATFQSAVNQLSNASRSLNFSTNPDNQPTQIANLTRDIALNQLDIQQKALELNKKVTQIQLNLAEVNESLMFPASPCPGTIQKVFVHIGQSVSPGTPLITIYSPQGNISAVARVPMSVATTISQIDQSNILLPNGTFSELPRFVSSQATDGQLYSVIYDIPQQYRPNTTNSAYLTVEIPVGHSNSNSEVPFIPLDAVFQTQDSALVYVIDHDQAASKKIELGDVLGQEVQVKSGLVDGDQIILNRNIIAGDKVTANNR